jgi:hypothetical protein
MKLVFDLSHFGDVAGSSNDKGVTFMLLRNENEHYIDHPRHAGHRAPGDVTLVLSGPQAGAHMLERQLSRLDAQHLLEPASDYLIAPQTVSPFSSGVQVFVDERASCRRAEQREPVRRIVEVGLQACLACGELERPFLDPLLK